MPYGSKLHIPLANYHLASQQEQSLSLNKKGWRNFYLKKKRERGKKKKEEKEREKIRKKKKKKRGKMGHGEMYPLTEKSQGRRDQRTRQKNSHFSHLHELGIPA